MRELVQNQGVNVGKSLRNLGEAEQLLFPVGINELTIRNAATRLKNTAGMGFVVNRRKNGILVTRIY